MPFLKCLALLVILGLSATAGHAAPPCASGKPLLTIGTQFFHNSRHGGGEGFQVTVICRDGSVSQTLGDRGGVEYVPVFQTTTLANADLGGLRAALDRAHIAAQAGCSVTLDSPLDVDHGVFFKIMVIHWFGLGRRQNQFTFQTGGPVCSPEGRELYLALRAFELRVQLDPDATAL